MNLRHPTPFVHLLPDDVRSQLSSNLGHVFNTALEVISSKLILKIQDEGDDAIYYYRKTSTREKLRARRFLRQYLALPNARGHGK